MTDKEHHEVADYIVVGAGTSSSIVASELAKRGYSVIMIEAGPRLIDDPSVIKPLGYIGLYNLQDGSSPKMDPRFVWQMFGQPDTGNYGNRTLYPNGRSWGGSSSVNYMFFINGNTTVFNEDFPEGWKAKDMYPYLDKVQEIIKPYRTPIKYNVSQVFLQALRDIKTAQLAEGGTNWLTNVTTGNNLSNIESPEQSAPQLDYLYPGNNVVAFANYIYFIKELPDGTFIRNFTGNNFLSVDKVNPFTGCGIGPYRGLGIASNSTAERIVFKKKKAKGVVWVDFYGKSHYSKARKEVIVGCGAIQTPTLLQRSGLGDFTIIKESLPPKEICRSPDHIIPAPGVTIPPPGKYNPITQAPPGQLTASSSVTVMGMVVPEQVLNNPQVGKNLHNETGVFVGYGVTGPDAAAFMQTITTPIPSTLGFFGGSFLNFHPLDPNKPANWEQVSYRKYQQLITGLPLLPEQTRVTYKITGDNFYILIVDERSVTSGIVNAVSPNTTETPEIHFNSYVLSVNPTSLEQASQESALAISGILALDISYQIAVAMNNAAFNMGYKVNISISYPPPPSLALLREGLQAYGATWWYYLFPSINPLAPDPAFSDLLQQLVFYLRLGISPQSHQMSTASIGPVLDTTLKVKGVERLRVVDASALPNLVGGNCAAVIMATGLRAVDFILADEGKC